MAYVWVVIIVARLLYWLYQRHGDKKYRKQWYGTPDGEPAARDVALPPRPPVAPEHLLPEGRDA